MLNDIYQSLDPVAFSIGPLSVRWYGLAYMAAFVCFALVVRYLAKRWKIKIDFDALSVIVLCIIVGVIVGARLGYVAFYQGTYYLENPAQILAFHQGGMSFHGGMLGALLGGFVAAKFTKIPFLTLADLGAIAAPIGLFFGRLANFVNGELWGAPTDAAWGVVFQIGGVARHPSMLYEAFLEGIVLFVVLFFLARRRPALPRGAFLGIFLIMYGIFRFVIEFIREPDIQLGYLWGDWFTMGQLLSLPMVLVGIGLLIYAVRKKLPQAGIAEQQLSEMDDSH